MSEFRFARCRHLYFNTHCMPDPRALVDSDGEDGVIGRVHHALHPLGGGLRSPDVITLSREDAEILEWVATAYHHLTTHPAGTESTVKQLREIRRALKTLEKEEAP